MLLNVKNLVFVFYMGSFTIETEQQSNIYSALLDVKESFSKLYDTVIATGKNVDIPPIISDYQTGYLIQTSKGLVINPNCINFL